MGNMGSWMITVVEDRNVATRILSGDEEIARRLHNRLRELKNDKPWLSVTLSRPEQDPMRSDEETARAVGLITTAFGPEK